MLLLKRCQDKYKQVDLPNNNSICFSCMNLNRIYLDASLLGQVGTRYLKQNCGRKVFRKNTCYITENLARMVKHLFETGRSVTMLQVGWCDCKHALSCKNAPGHNSTRKRIQLKHFTVTQHYNFEQTRCKIIVINYKNPSFYLSNLFLSVSHFSLI